MGKKDLHTHIIYKKEVSKQRRQRQLNEPAYINLWLLIKWVMFLILRSIEKSVYYAFHWLICERRERETEVKRRGGGTE